jgi:hypothetical protein
MAGGGGEGAGRRSTRRAIIATALALLVLVGAVAARAGALPPPRGEVLLTVTGRIEHTTAPGRAEFDRAMLEALGLHTVRTSTVWTDGVLAFEGPLLCDVLDRVGASGKTLVARALNDYWVEIPVEDCRRFPVLLALKRDGRELQRRDKGPIWIVYPRDAHAELRSQEVNTRWIWQLDRLEVR